MSKSKSERRWVYQPEAPKFGAQEKSEIIGKVKSEIERKKKLSSKVTRIDIRGNRIYLYEQIEVEHKEGIIYTKQLIEDEYMELAYARISIKDQGCKKCILEWQRYNDKWMPMYEGELKSCIEYIEKDDGRY